MSRLKSIRAYILETAKQLERGVPLTPEQMKFWAHKLRLIGEGMTPEDALDLRRRRGEKVQDEPKRQKISLVIHLIASYCNPLIDPRVPREERSVPLDLKSAIEKVLPLVPRIMNDGHIYDFEQVRSWWYDENKLHMRSPLRSSLDPDNPYPTLKCGTQ
jgi:hypothetical protein